MVHTGVFREARLTNLQEFQAMWKMLCGTNVLCIFRNINTWKQSHIKYAQRDDALVKKQCSQSPYYIQDHSLSTST